MKIDPREHVGLVFMACNQFVRGTRRRADDYLGIAYEAMVNAARTFDPAKSKWSTHAMSCMRLQLMTQVTLLENDARRAKVQGRTTIVVNARPLSQMHDAVGEGLGEEAADDLVSTPADRLERLDGLTSRQLALLVNLQDAAAAVSPTAPALIEMRRRGLTPTQAATAVGCNPEYVRELLRRVKAKAKEMTEATHGSKPVAKPRDEHDPADAKGRRKRRHADRRTQAAEPPGPLGRVCVRPPGVGA